MPHILLVGAGFSRNWKGWLASEIGSDLAGRLADDPYLSGILTRSDGFEAALSRVQAEFKSAPGDETKARLRKFQDAIQATFGAMNDAFVAMTDYEFTNDYNYQITPFLTKFDAIFTLNQDLLLELHYRERMVIPAQPRWSGCEFPGMVPRVQQGGGLSDARSVIWQPGDKFEVARNLNRSSSCTDRPTGATAVAANSLSWAPTRPLPFKRRRSSDGTRRNFAAISPCQTPA